MVGCEGFNAGEGGTRGGMGMIGMFPGARPWLMSVGVCCTYSPGGRTMGCMDPPC